MQPWPQGHTSPISFWKTLLMNWIKADPEIMESFLLSISVLLFTLIISLSRLNYSIKNGHIPVVIKRKA